MRDRFDKQAQRLVPQQIDPGGGFARLIAGALRSTDAAAEIRAVEWCLEEIVEVLPFSRRQDMLIDRIAELKKGGVL